MTVAEILSELNDYGFTDTGTPRKTSFINHIVNDICNREPWPFMEAEITLTFDGVSATPTNYPANFRAAIKVINPSDGQRIQPVRLDDAEDYYATQLTEPGVAFGYYFLGGTMRFVRIPPSTTTMRMRYIKSAAVLTDSSTEAAIAVPPRHHGAIVQGVLMRLYDLEDDVELSTRAEQHYEGILQRMREDLWKRHYDAPDYVHVFDPEDTLWGNYN